MEKREIKIIDTKEGVPSLSVDKVLIHSKYYPLKEAEKLVESWDKIYKDKKSVVVYGLGFGYHIKELLKKASSNVNIYVFDADTEVVKEGSRLGVYEDLKKDKRVRIITSNNQDFFTELNKALELVEEIIIYKPSMKVLSDKWEVLKRILTNFELGKIAVERFGSLMNENYEANLKVTHSKLRDFFKVCDVRDKTVVIAASGPSLDFSIQAMKKFREKFKIFTVGSALRTLINNGIIPDMVVIVDSQEIVSRQLMGFEHMDIPLCFLNTASRWAVENYKGSRYMFFNRKNEENDIIINTGKTVAVAAIDIAVKGKAKRIILTGQDLAYINNKTHTESFTETYNMSNAAPKEEPSARKVLGVDGEMLSTTEGFLYFKYAIEKEIETNPQVEFINSSRGARILGAKEMKLEDVSF